MMHGDVTQNLYLNREIRSQGSRRHQRWIGWLDKRGDGGRARGTILEQVGTSAGPMSVRAARAGACRAASGSASPSAAPSAGAGKHRVPGRADRGARRASDAARSRPDRRACGTKGIAVVLISHNMEQVLEAVVDRVVVLRLGLHGRRRAGREPGWADAGGLRHRPSPGRGPTVTREFRLGLHAQGEAAEGWARVLRQDRLPWGRVDGPDRPIIIFDAAVPTWCGPFVEQGGVAVVTGAPRADLLLGPSTTATLNRYQPPGRGGGAGRHGSVGSASSTRTGDGEIRSHENHKARNGGPMSGRRARESAWKRMADLHGPAFVRSTSQRQATVFGPSPKSLASRSEWPASTRPRSPIR